MKKQKAEYFSTVNFIKQKNSGKAKGGFPLYIDDEEKIFDASDSHTLTIGAPGSFKSRAVVYSLILSCMSAKKSMVIHDCKGEIFTWTKAELEANDYCVKIVDFRNPIYCQSDFSLFSLPARNYQEGKIDDAVIEVQNIFDILCKEMDSQEDPYWNVTARQFLTGIFLMACELNYTPEEVSFSLFYKLLLEGMKKSGGKTYFEIYLELSDNRLLEEHLYPTLNTASDTQACILSFVTATLARYSTQSAMNDILSGEPFDINAFLARPSALFLVTRDESTTYSPLYGAIINILYERLLLAKTNNAKLREVAFILDEFALIHNVPDMPEKVAAARSRGIRFHLIIQALPQLSALYGQDDAANILACCQVMLYLYSPDMTTNRYISERIGFRQGEFVLQPNDLSNLEEGVGVIFYRRDKPFFTKYLDKDEYRRAYRIELKAKGSRNVGCQKRIIRDVPDSRIKDTVDNLKQKHMEKLSKLLDSQKDKEMAEIAWTMAKTKAKIDLKEYQVRHLGTEEER